MLRRISLLVVLMLVFVACNAGGGSEPSTTSTTVVAETTTIPAETTTTEGAPSTTTTVPPTTPTTEPDLSGVEGISDEVRAQLEELIREAQEIRDLPFLTPPTITVVTSEELSERVRADIEAETEDFPADEALYKMLGLLAESADFESIVVDLYGEQVAGFYDGDTGEIVVPAREDGFSVVQQGTMVHELVHALTDQHFSFDDKFHAMFEEERLDEGTAYQALIEGDAMLAQVLWIQTLTDEEIGQFIAESLQVDSSTLEAAPRFLREALLFPYDTGLNFAQTLYVQDGWSPINEAYSELVTLPGSSEQVITPDDYAVDLPVEVAIPEIAIPGYELERTSVWGEQGFRTLLNQGVLEAEMPVAADGWGGDSYHQWFDGENAAMLIVYEGDTAGDVRELEDALLTFATEVFPEEHFAWVEQLNGDLYFIAADDPDVGELIRAEAGLD